ncbi:MAG: hypothetical protein HC886_23130 [Leptolyngbyaceae cyanobacterium SM1_1_3]|nr:hypothetical protein [Leptolyngbyaceae cyanobacterium SM1_1_3]
MNFLSDPQVSQILATMTLEQKLGQLFLVYFEGAELSDPLREMILTYHVGGVILYTVSGNTETPEQMAGLNRQLQDLAPIPLWIGIDQEGGSVLDFRLAVPNSPA